MSTPFRERNPVIIGAVSLAVIAALHLAAFRADDLPLIGGGDTYYAAFSEAGGLKANDEVRVAGVRVGKVDEVELDGDHVKVELPGRAATSSSARRPAPRSRSRRCSGAMYLALEPAGSGQLEEGAEIPVERTTSPYDVVEAFAGLAEHLRSGSTPPSSPQSLDTLADLDPQHARRVPGRAARVSRRCPRTSRRATSSSTPCSRTCSKVSGVLGDRDEDIIALMKDGDVLFRALVARREAIHNLLVSTSQAVRAAHRAGRRTPAPTSSRRSTNLDTWSTLLQQEPGQPRRQPAADGAVLPRLRQHARQRPLVRHAHPEPAARSRSWEGLTWTSRPRRQAGRDRRRSLVVGLLRGRRRRSRCSAPATTEDAHRVASRAPSRSTRAPRSGSSACRSARSRPWSPAGTTVKVTMNYDAEVDVPADAKAVIIAPAIVGDRFVQLTPAYTAGPKLEDDAVARHWTSTAVPLELDQIYQSLDDLTVALGPKGANKEGALSDLLDDHRAQLRRPGRAVQPDHPATSASSPGRWTNNKEELFATAAELERFVRALAGNDQTVRDFNDSSLAAVSGLLAGRARGPRRRPAQPRRRACGRCRRS